GFRALWSPYFLTFLIAVSIVYYLVTGPYRHKFGGDEKPTRNQQLFFYSGIILTYIVKGSPIDLMSHIMMSYHMAQTAILYFVNFKIVKKIMKVTTHPLIALVLFNSLFSMYHLPVIFDYTKTHLIVHSTVTIVLFILSMNMWWPILSPLKEHATLNPLLKMAYLIGSILIISIACALMIFSTKSLYTSYNSDGAWLQAMSLCVPPDVLNGISDSLSGAEMFSPLSAAEDQQLGGILM